MQLNKKNKRLSLISLISGYCIAVAFMLLIGFGRNSPDLIAQIDPDGPIVEKNSTKTEFIYVDREVSPRQIDTLYSDRLTGIIIDEEPHVAVVKNGHRGVIESHTDYFSTHRDTVIDKSGIDIIAKNDLIYENHQTELTTRNRDIGIDTLDGGHRGNIRRNDNRSGNNAADSLRVDGETDILEQRLREFEKDKVGLGNKGDEGIDFSNLIVANRKDGDLDLELDLDNFNKKGTASPAAGELYAYNSPRLGVGAGIGESSIGAGAGGSAGLSAGIGEAVMNGTAVPTLGGIGTSGAPAESDLGSKPMTGMPGMQNAAGEPVGASDGVGGLVSGSGAGAAAGLLVKKVYKNLGLGAPGLGGGTGQGKGYNYDHLPKDGALHIMMHVDGSGSILNTRKQLDIMKETILKEALLPYYNNNENLYNKRVTIISSAGERTLRFFNEAAKKDNVLAIAFQDEAQPAYHLPNFNKKPEDQYLDDLRKLKTSLNGYGGTYRGIMFQVDRGKTFAKSFKEFVSNAFRGEGYLGSANLKKYYRDNNTHYIKNKNGVVFSDEYHAKDSGDPKYYLDLIFNASKKVGLDLDIYGAGLTDGTYNKN